MLLKAKLGLSKQYLSPSKNQAPQQKEAKSHIRCIYRFVSESCQPLLLLKILISGAYSL